MPLIPSESRHVICGAVATSETGAGSAETVGCIDAVTGTPRSGMTPLGVLAGGSAPQDHLKN